MVELPIDGAMKEIISQVRASRALVLVAEPGAGKTTRVAPAILKAGILSAEHPNIVMLQPRRVAARASAERIAEENGWTLGREVGYQIRFEKRITSDTRLRVMTEGILTPQLVDDPFLGGIGCVILDEFHERSLHTDVASALLREIRATVREDLILIVMSATLDAGPVAEFLGGAPVISVKGRMFPTAVEYRAPAAGAAIAPIWQLAAAEVAQVVESSEGDVLVFLPGVEEIRRTMELLGARLGGAVRILPLHGSLSAQDQSAAIRPSKPGERKVICATNIAETSLTIDGVRTVVDSGLARVSAYDVQRGLDQLELRRISKASATQRAGRAGRTGPGKCVRLWSEREQQVMGAFERPEIQRVDLAGTVLSLHAWGQNPRTFGWYEAPQDAMVTAAERLLEMLGAITAERDGKITTLGRQILSLPVHPRLGRLMVEGARRGLIHEAAGIAAILSEKDFVIRERSGPQERGPSDVLKRLELLAAHDRFADVDIQGLQQVLRVRDDLIRIASRLESPGKRAASENDLLKLVLAAYPDRVCRRRTSDRDAAAMVGGIGVRLDRQTLVQDSEYFVAADARSDDRARAREAMVRIASAIEPQWLEELFPQEVSRRTGAVFDQTSERVIGISGVYYRDLVLREERDTAVDELTAARTLAEALAPRGRELFDKDDRARNLLGRLEFLRKWMPEHDWPAIDEAGMKELLFDAARGKRSASELDRGSALAAAIDARLQWPLDRLLAEHAPETITVPTGNQIRLEYPAGGGAPALAVRLQEVFGWIDTPRIAGGRVAVVMHLLGPNYRSVQVTSDLRSFWAGIYFQVRKDLRAQYPKHSWPEDPLTAVAVAKGRPRR